MEHHLRVWDVFGGKILCYGYRLSGLASHLHRRVTFWSRLIDFFGVGPVRSIDPIWSGISNLESRISIFSSPKYCLRSSLPLRNNSNYFSLYLSSLLISSHSPLYSSHHYFKRVSVRNSIQLFPILHTFRCQCLRYIRPRHYSVTSCRAFRITVSTNFP